MLKNNRNINIELNSFAPEGVESDTSKKTFEYLSAQDAYDYIIAGGIDRSREICDHFAETKLPMYRIVKR